MAENSSHTRAGDLAGRLRGLSIQTKLVIGCTASFLLVLILASLVLYSMIRATIASNIEHELTTSTQTILNMVQSVVDAAIHNHLRATAEHNRDILTALYQKTRGGRLPESEARRQAREILLAQKIGKTGYVYCIDSRGIIQVHPNPELQGVDLSSNDFIQIQKHRKEGYLEYDWANPGEAHSRPKALYMTYFGPWDWIISVSSYREEFTSLIEVADFRERILSITFGRTGYPYVMNTRGELIIHPKLEGTNIYASTDATGRMFIKEICEKRTGRIVYPWINPGEKTPREKLVIFNYIPELDWIVASSSYLEEFNRPLESIRIIVILTVMIILALIFPLTWWISVTIIRPLRLLKEKFGRSARGDFSQRMEIGWGGEIDDLALYYNGFMDQLDSYNQRLKESEEKYRGIFDHALEGVFQCSPAGRILSANSAMAATLGYTSPAHLIESVSDFGRQVYVDPDHRVRILDTLSRTGTMTNVETRFRCRDGRIIWVMLNVRGIRDEAGSLLYTEGFMSDISARKASEELQIRSREELENSVQERTHALSEHVRELEAINRQNALLREMGEMIGVCRNVSETFPVIQGFMKRLFPGNPGAIYIRSPHRPEMAAAVTWGENGFHADAVHPDHCWAMRQGKVYTVTAPARQVLCRHLPAGVQSEYICVPMLAQSEVIGLAHIRFMPSGRSDAEVVAGRAVPALERLAITIAEHLALALANLELRETLRRQSVQDSLTGLYNRRFMEHAFTREVARACRHESHLSLVLLDVDHFKQVNDTYGHEAGDAVLRTLGSYLKNASRSEDLVCRYGGEEFALILVGTPFEEAVKKAEMLRVAISGNLRINYDTNTIRVTASFGVSSFPDHGMTTDAAFRAADRALYQAKAAGRNRVGLATDGESGGEEATPSDPSGPPAPG